MSFRGQLLDCIMLGPQGAHGVLFERLSAAGLQTFVAGAYSDFFLSSKVFMWKNSLRL